MKNSSKVIIGILLAILSIGMILGGYFLVSRFTNQKPEVVEQEEDEEKDEARVVEIQWPSNPYKGEYIEASLPDGWSIKEYENGTNFDDDLKGVFEGLTGIVVFDGEERNVFSINASASGGYGVLEYCGEVNKFSDTDPEYFKDQYKQNLEYAENLGISEDEIQIVDLSSKSYSDIQFLDMKIRRIGTDIYYFNEDGKMPLCEFMAVFVYDGLEYEIVDQRIGWYSDNNYQIAIEPGVSEENLELLDKIIGSIKVVRESTTEPDEISKR